MEYWKDIPGYEGLYQINIDTKECRCRSLNYRQTGTIRELSNKPNKQFNRIYWGLTKNGKTEKPQAAVLVAKTFPELVQNEYFEGAEIDHIDTDRLNNQPANLRWVTRKENLNNPLTIINNSNAQKQKKFTLEHRNKIIDGIRRHYNKNKEDE